MPSITKRFVDAAAPGRHYDDKLPGFGLYVGTSGARSYFLEYLKRTDEASLTALPTPRESVLSIELQPG